MRFNFFKARGRSSTAMRAAAFACALMLSSGLALPAAGDGVSGVVHDFRAQVLPGAEVQVQSESTGARRKTRTDDEGRYAVAGLPPGPYKVTVRMAGFRTVARGGAILDAGQSLALDFSMELLTLHEVITVVSGHDEIDPSTSDSLLMTRTSPGATLPINGNDFRASFDLLPGVVITPAGVSDAGQFTSNGQRPNASAYRVDGVSANTGVGGSGLPGSFPGASLPAMTAIGTTENLASPETTQSVELRTSAFAPEYGERPGAQASVTTRCGSNEFHGEGFSQLRDSGWAARDWFANSLGLSAFPRSTYRRFGGVIGGPVWRNRTFFFAGLESSRLNYTGIEVIQVPSLQARLNAPAALLGSLDYFPPPLSPDLSDGTAVGNGQVNRIATLRTANIRLDQSLGSHGTLFMHAVDSPSTSQSSLFDTSSGTLHWSSITVGLTAGRSKGTIYETRSNYSRARLSSRLSDLWAPVFSLAGFNSFQASRSASVYALGQPDAARTLLGLSVPGIGQFIGGDMGSPRQDQWELRQTMGRSLGRHQLRVGVDYTRLRASRDSSSATIIGAVPGLESLLNGGTAVLTYSPVPQEGRPVHAGSLFAQDTFRAGERLTLVYGFRAELTPPSGSQIPGPNIMGSWTGSAWRLAFAGDVYGTAPWPLRYNQIAPRLGLGYRLPGSSLALRAGAGLFYDATLGASLNPVNGAPFNSWLLAGGGTGSAGGGYGSIGSWPDGGSAPDVVRFLTGYSPALQLPASYQWRATIETALGRRGTASAGYFGSKDAHLLGNEAYVDPATGVLVRRVILTGSSSNYQALQLRYTGNLASNLFASFSYAWSHSIDNGSQDSGVFLIHPSYRLDETRASSNFDVRHALTAALSYRVPRWAHLNRALVDWTVSGILRARSGFPVDLYMGEQALGQSFYNVGHPDRVPGAPVWISDSSVGGGRRLNPAAFSAPSSGRQGTLGRNSITGNGLAQWDASLRREFPIYRRISLEAVVTLFNVLNHPAFSDPVPYLSSPFFGMPISMQNLMLGSGTPNTGLPALFQSGGARSAELSFRLMF